MKMTRTALFISLCVAAGALTAPAVVSAGVGIDIDIAPPAPQVEIVPGPRAGYIWAPDRWEQRGPHWHHNAGHWER